MEDWARDWLKGLSKAAGHITLRCLWIKTDYLRSPIKSTERAVLECWKSLRGHGTRRKASVSPADWDSSLCTQQATISSLWHGVRVSSRAISGCWYPVMGRPKMFRTTPATGSEWRTRPHNFNLTRNGTRAALVRGVLSWPTNLVLSLDQQRMLNSSHRSITSVRQLETSNSHWLNRAFFCTHVVCGDSSREKIRPCVQVLLRRRRPLVTMCI